MLGTRTRTRTSTRSEYETVSTRVVVAGYRTVLYSHVQYRKDCRNEFGHAHHVTPETRQRPFFPLPTSQPKNGTPIYLANSGSAAI